MTNILIVNFVSRLNKGSAALLNSKIKMLSDFIPGATFTISTYHPEIDYNQYDIKIVDVVGKILPFEIMIGQLGLSFLFILDSILKKIFGVRINISIRGIKLQEYAIQSDAKTRIKNSLASFSTIFLLFRVILRTMLQRFGLNISKSFYGKILQDYYNADIVLNTGGDVLTEDYGSSLSHFVNLLFATLLNKPVVICAESLGPYKKKWSRFIAKFVLNKAKLITLREKLSLQYLQDINVNIPSIYITTDVAFLLESVSDQRIKEILIKEGIINKPKPLIGISVSKIISNYGFTKLKSQKDKYNEYITLMSKVVDSLIDILNTIIIFVPHVIGPGYNDDRIVADDIYKLVKNKDKIISIKEEYTPEELKGIIGQCELFIGARMHAAIASTSMHIPTVGIAYSHKMHGIIGEMLGQERYILDIKDLNYENLILKINDAWKNREEIKKELETKIPFMQEKAMLNGKLFKELLDSLKIS